MRRRAVLDERCLPTGKEEPVRIEPGPLRDRVLDDLFTEKPEVQDGMIQVFKDMVSDYDIDGFRIEAQVGAGWFHGVGEVVGQGDQGHRLLAGGRAQVDLDRSLHGALAVDLVDDAALAIAAMRSPTIARSATAGCPPLPS